MCAAPMLPVLEPASTVNMLNFACKLIHAKTYISVLALVYFHPYFGRFHSFFCVTEQREPMLSVIAYIMPLSGYKERFETMANEVRCR